MPRRFSRPVEIPVDVDAMWQNGGFNNLVTVAIESMHGIPSHWQVELIERSGGGVLISADRPEVIHPFLLRTATSRSDAMRRDTQATGSLGTDARRSDNLTGDTFSDENLNIEAKLMRVRASESRFILRITPTEIDPEVPVTFGLGQNYPNPFNPTTRIPFELPTDGVVTLEIYDITGRRVATILNEYRPAGRHLVTWNATGLASGIYLYRLTTPESAFTRRLTLIK
jgi:hypothetical protein